MIRFAGLGLTLITVVVLSAAERVAVAATTISFDTQPEGSVLNVQYASLGVTFPYQQPNNTPRVRSAATYVTDPNTPPFATHSPPLFVVGPDFGEEFNDSDLRMVFSSPQSLVRLYGGTKCVSSSGTLSTFDEFGTPVAPEVSLPLVTGAASVLFMISTGTAVIREVRFKVSPACSEVIDDLYFEGEAPPPPSTPPGIVLQQPNANPVDNRYASVNAIGTIQGTNLFQLQIDLVSLDTPSGQPTTESFFPPLSQTTGTGIPFSRLLADVGELPVGRYRVVATVTDWSGQSAQASVSFSFFPGELSTNVDMGAFRFSVVDRNCHMAFYEQGAMAYREPGGPFTRVPLGIAEKWRTVNSPILGPTRTLGCPIADFDISLGWHSQDFERGRIYQPATGVAHYVPTILTNAFQALAHRSTGVPLVEALQVGWPATDPEYYLDSTDPVWVFQRFSQNDRGPGFWNTVEIRGRAPILYVERIGGDIAELMAAGFRTPGSAPEPIVTESTPTQWQQFPCAAPLSGTNSWPASCDLSSLLQPPYPRTGIDGTPYCKASASCTSGATCGGCPDFPSKSSDGPPAWQDVYRRRNYTDAVYHGIVRTLDGKGPNPGSHLADSDFFLVHDHCSDNNGFVDDTGMVLEDIGACTVGLIGGACERTVGSHCRADWNLHTRPLPTLNDWAFLSNENISPDPNDPNATDFEIEFEAAYAQSYFVRFQPVIGDLIFAHGRQIVDCAHCPYNAEIHPPDTLAVSRSRVTDYNNRDAIRHTAAYLWVNGFFPEFGVVPVTIYAPPRPSLFATLEVFTKEAGYYQKFPVDNAVHDGVELRTDYSPIVGGYQVVFSAGTPRADDYVPPASYVGDYGQWHYPGKGFFPHPTPYFVDRWELTWRDR